MNDQIEKRQEEFFQEDCIVYDLEPSDYVKSEEEMALYERLSIQFNPGYEKVCLLLKSYYEGSGNLECGSIALSPDELRSVAGKLIEIAGILETGGFEKQEILLAEYKENC